MRPSFAAMDVPNIRWRDAKLLGYIFLWNSGGAHRSNVQDIRLGKFALAAPFATIVSAMEKLITHIFAPSSPNKMMGRAASIKTISAKVSDFVRGGWRFPVNDLANYRMNRSSSAIMSYRPVSVAVGVVRPFQALWPSVSKNNIFEKCKMLSGRTLERLKRVALRLPSIIMTDAPSARMDSLPAVWDRAYTRENNLEGSFTCSLPPGIMTAAPATADSFLAAALNRAYGNNSHFDLQDRLAWLERAAMLLHPARSSFIPAFGLAV